MRHVIEVRPLPEWTVGGKVYKATQPVYTTAPAEFDQHQNFQVGNWSPMPGRPGEAAHDAFLARLVAQSAPGAHPTMQRFEFRLVETPDASDTLADFYRELPVKKLDGSAGASPFSVAEARIAELVAENERLKAIIEEGKTAASGRGKK